MRAIRMAVAVGLAAVGMAASGASEAAATEPIEGIWKSSNGSFQFEIYSVKPNTFQQRGLGSICAGQPLDFNVTGSGRHYTGTVRFYRKSDCTFAGKGHVDVSLSQDLNTLTYHEDPPSGCCSATFVYNRVKPAAGKTANARLIQGTVTVQCPGQAQSNLDAGAQVKLGCTVDATKGGVAIDAATGTGKTESAQFSQGGFVLSQIKPAASKSLSAAKAAKPKPLITLLTLTGPDPGPCPKGSIHATRRGRHLFGKGTGHFRTKGRHAAATVRGTEWLTEERCDGTFIKVKKGSVSVFDFTLKKTVIVTAPKTYLAKAK